MRGPYNHYPEQVKFEIATAKNPYLFPHLKIPRKTAEYWISLGPSHFRPTSIDEIYKKQLESVRVELEKERVLKNFMLRVRRIFPHDFGSRHVSLKKQKRLIVMAVRRAMRYHTLKTCLAVIRLSKTTFSRWVSEFTRCMITFGKCGKKHPNQLTDLEVFRMKRLFKSKKLSHMTLRQLCLHAQREGLLFSSVDTWRKYINLFDWKRQRRLLKYQASDKKGLRAENVNDIWHLDVTHLKLLGGKEVYLQAIVDNVSRYIIAWHITTDVCALNTRKLLRLARRRALKNGLLTEVKVVTDSGKENKAELVENYCVSSKNLTRVLARVDIKESNSLVEAFFKSLKNNYFYFQKRVPLLKDIKRKISFYIRQHNQVLPHSAFNGATPQEIYNGTWTSDNERRLIEKRQEAMDKRRRAAKAPTCSVCA